MPPVVAAAGIAAAAGLIGAGISAHSAGSAAKTQSDAAAAALAEQKRIFDLQRADRQPYVNASLGALGQAQNVAGMSHYMPLPAQRLGASSQPAPMAPQMPPQGQPMALGQLGQSTQPPQGGNEPMGLFKAPTGETKSFPLRLQQQLEAKGAMRVQ